MRHLVLLSLVTSTLLLRADEPGQLLFSDDFNRADTAVGKDDLANGWTTNSPWRAPGKKQATIKDGVVVAGTDASASHALVLFHPAGLRDGSVEFRFKVPEKEGISVEFADPECNSVHAGHLASVRVKAGQLGISDLKTGVMDLQIKARREAVAKGQKDPELNALLKTKDKTFPVECKANEWHTLRFSVKGGEITASLDGKVAGSFASEGFAHPTKAEIRINVGKAAEIDDVKIWKAN